VSAEPGMDGAYRRTVFVIHGRNEQARKALFEFLRSLGLNPIEWAQAIALTGKGAPYIGDVLDAAFSAARAIVVLQTPDDVAYLHESLAEPGDPECKPQMQPRPNVLFEAGIAMGRDVNRTVIVELGKVKSFSDIHGRHVVKLDNSIGKRQDLATRLKTAGCDVQTTGTAWHEAGDLRPPAAAGDGLPLGKKLPSSQASGLPRLEARYIDRGSRKLGDVVVVTNYGPGDVYELDVATDDEQRIHRDATELPVPRLPQGKSVTVLRVSPATLGGLSHSYFTVNITGRTADGTPINVPEFVSAA